jgi:acetyl esterase/lipase
MIVFLFLGLRWLLALVLSLLSLLSICKPPTYLFWKLSILVLEGGHYLVLPTFLLGLLCLYPGMVSHWSAILFFCSTTLFASPYLRAIGISHKLEQQITTEWGPPLHAEKFLAEATEKSWQRKKALSFSDLYTGIPVGNAKFQTLTYETRTDGDLHLDFYPPLTRAIPPPCVIIIHGGGWDGGTRSQLPTLNRFLVQGGYAVASIQYRLAPKHQYPAPVEDVGKALHYLTDHASELGIDPLRFVLLGRSAGGQIALQAAYTSHNPSIKGVISFYAPADMIFGYKHPTDPLILNSGRLMEQYLGGGYSQLPEKYFASSPVEHLTINSTPTLLLHGRGDVLVSFKHTVHMQARMKAVGMHAFVVDIPWGAHGYDFVFRGPGSQISLYAIEHFLDMVVP